ncbi:hypothetical protein B0H19DRAFT_1076292 [Mycena capillaripes]|nr:hypothetical protein B0H19DRAFT_1076292 [Mycena capillaripes]
MSWRSYIETANLCAIASQESPGWTVVNFVQAVDDGDASKREGGLAGSLIRYLPDAVVLDDVGVEEALLEAEEAGDTMCSSSRKHTAQDIQGTYLDPFEVISQKLGKVYVMVACNCETTVILIVTSVLECGWAIFTSQLKPRYRRVDNYMPSRSSKGLGRFASVSIDEPGTYLITGYSLRNGDGVATVASLDSVGLSAGGARIPDNGKRKEQIESRSHLGRTVELLGSQTRPGLSLDWFGARNKRL